LPTTPIFKAHGDDFDADRAVGFTLRDVTLDGNEKQETRISFLMASDERLERVNMKNLRGNGIYAEEWRDSVAHDCFLRTLDAIRQLCLESP
jgi:hypothetical protein